MTPSPPEQWEKCRLSHFFLQHAKHAIEIGFEANVEQEPHKMKLKKKHTEKTEKRRRKRIVNVSFSFDSLYLKTQKRNKYIIQYR